MEIVNYTIYFKGKKVKDAFLYWESKEKAREALEKIFPAPCKIVIH